MRARHLFCALALTSCADPEAVAPDFHVEQVDVTANGRPYFVRGELGRVAQVNDVADVPEAFAKVLPALAEVLRVPAEELVATQVIREELGTHVKFQHHVDGVRVIGGDVVVHVAPDGVIRAVNSTARNRGALSSRPRVPAQQAEQVAQAATQGPNEVKHTELVFEISTNDDSMRLTWEVRVAGTEALVDDVVYVDAHTGSVVDRRPQVFTARTRSVKDGLGLDFPFALVGPEVGNEASPPSGDDIAKAAFDNVGKTYDCWKTLYARDSFDNAGGKLTSTVHVMFPRPDGGASTGNNAGWALDQMIYGDGDGDVFAPLAFGFDVTAHEVSHGVTAKTAALAYQNESGALNEAMSDIVAARCSAWADDATNANTWLIGEEIYTPNEDGDALRYMSNPTLDKDMYPPELGGSRDFYPERYAGTEDNGGVHLNSGIANLAFYLASMGGKHPRDKTTFTVPKIGLKRASKIFQRALTKGYFTENTDFAGARAATEQVARDVYPGTSAAESIGLAWAAVGVGEPPDLAGSEGLPDETEAD